MKKARKLAALLLTLFIILGSFSALAANTTKTITLKTNTDNNPFIRIALYSQTFAAGGPFTVHCEMKISSYTRSKEDANIFVNIADGRDPKQMVVWLNTWKRKNDKWFAMKDENGNDITFNNISKVQIDGVFQDFALLQFGAYYVKGEMSFRNFYITNAAGKTVYSWDTDSALNGIDNLKNYEGNVIFYPTFGDGSADYLVSDTALSGGDTPVTPTSPTKDSGPVYDDDPTVKPPVTTVAPISPTSPGNTSTEDNNTTASNSQSVSTETSLTTGESEAASSSQATTTTTENAQGSMNGKKEDKGGFNIWIPIGVIGGLLIAGGAVLLILWKLDKLPWKKSSEDAGGVDNEDIHSEE